jgi:hypothetical protein
MASRSCNLVEEDFDCSRISDAKSSKISGSEKRLPLFFVQL